MKTQIIILTIVALIMGASPALAKKPVTIEGEFEGAMYTIYGNQRPAKLTEAHIALEPDFVLEDSRGNHHLITNIDRSTKSRFLNEKVRVSGKISDGGALMAESLDVYKGSKFVNVWTLAQQEAERMAFIQSGP